MCTDTKTFCPFTDVIIGILFNILQYLLFANFSWATRNRFSYSGLFPILNRLYTDVKMLCCFRTDILSLAIISMTLSLKSFEYPMLLLFYIFEYLAIVPTRPTAIAEQDATTKTKSTDISISSFYMRNAYFYCYI